VTGASVPAHAGAPRIIRAGELGATFRPRAPNRLPRPRTGIAGPPSGAAVSAHEDLTGAEAALGDRLAVVGLRPATAHDYDPRVVEALTRVPARPPTSAWLDARGDGKDLW
jgi:hypothetical protein